MEGGAVGHNFEQDTPRDHLCQVWTLHTVDASCQVWLHLVKLFQRRRFFQKLSNQKQQLPIAAMFVNGSKLNEQSLQMTFHGCFLPNFYSFGKSVLETIFQKSANQKQELPVAAMLVNRSVLNEQFNSLERIFHRCFLPSFTSFG